MKLIEELHRTQRLVITKKLDYAYSGWIELASGFKGSVVFGFNENGWEHVSISSYNRRRLPTWEDMCAVKEMFWRPDEEVIQIHPSEDNYIHGVNGLKNVLHLWRPKDGNWELMNHPETR